MFTIITTADRSTIESAIGNAGIGNRRFHAQVRPSYDEPGTNIVSVPDWAGSILTGALRRIGEWFDRATPPGRVPHGRPIISHAGASHIKRYRKIDAADRRDREARRDAKPAS